jgi:Ras-related protein Rab-2A
MISFKLKLLLIDLSREHETGIVQKLSKSRFQANYKLTVGVDICTKDVEFRQGEIATLSIWDIGIQERFEFIRSTFYKGAAGIILIFNLKKEQTYIETKGWLSEIRDSAGCVPFLLIGININLLKLIEKNSLREEIREFTSNEGGFYVETSPKKFYNIDEAIHDLTRSIIYSRIKN